jgi:dTDP-4-dehydrorhamnose reductase
MEKILVTGANGFVGQHLTMVLAKKGYPVIATGRGVSRLPANDQQVQYYEADISHPFELQQLIEQEKPEIVVHCAAMSQVDECEQRQKEAHSINVEATARLLLDAEEHSRFFIFLSTDFVFDGENGYYKEEDAVNPISWYGHTKLEAEAVVQTSEIPWAIVRTCLVYGIAPEGGRSTIFSWLKNSLQEGKTIKVVDDQYRTPTYVNDLSAGIVLLIEQRKTGIWHISGEETFTPYGMAMAIAEKGGWDNKLLERVTADTFKQVGKRPAKTGFDITKAKKELGYQPGSFSIIAEDLLKY